MSEPDCGPEEIFMDNAPLEQLLRHVRRLVAPAGDDDGELLARFAARRDEAAFAALVRRHGPMVLGVCRSLLHDAHSADDAFQATFLVLLRRAASLEKRPSLGGWLSGVAYRTALKARTSAARRRTREGKAAAMTPTEVQDREADPELNAALHEELGRLPEKYRNPLIACYLQGQTTDEAARRLGCPRGTVLSRLSRGRDLLRARLSRRGITPATGIAVALAATAGAAVPPALAGATLKLGRDLVAGGVVTGTSAHLADAVLKQMTVAKFKLFGAVALVLLVAGIGAGLTASFWGGPGDEPPVASPEPHVDRNGDPLPEGAVARIGSRRLWAGPVGSVAISFPSEKRLVTLDGASDHKVHLWDVETGKEIVSPGRASHPRLGGSGVVVPVSADGKRFAFAGQARDRSDDTDEIIHVHETDKGAEVARIEAGNQVAPLALSADGKLLAATHFRVIPGADPNNPICDEIRIYAVDGGKEIARVGEGKLVTGGVAFSPDGKTLAVSEADSSITLWDVATGRLLHRLVGHRTKGTDFLLAVAFTADGKSVVSIGGDETVRTWDATTGMETASLGEIKGERATLSPGAEYAAVVSREKNAVEVWDVAGRKRLCSWQGRWPQSDGLGYAPPTAPTAFSPDGKVLAVGGWPRVELRSVETGKEMLPGHYGGVRAVALSPDGRVMGSDDGTLRLWETITGREIAPVVEQSGPPWPRIGFSEDGEDVFVTLGDTVRRLSAATGKEKDRTTYMGSLLGALAVSPDGKRALISGQFGEIPLIDTASGKTVGGFPLGDNLGPFPFVLPRDLTRSAAFSADGKTVAIANQCADFGDPAARGNEPKVKVWEVATGRLLAEFDSGGPVALSPDGKILATVGDKQPGAPPISPKVRLWDVATGQELRQLDTVVEAFSFFGLPLAFSPDGKLLATGGAEGSVRLWDAATGKVVADLKGSQGRVSSLAFSANGKLLASGGMDTTVLLWKVP
jgi:RNA polymerase sigma factor (sigma-70 family)